MDPNQPNTSKPIKELEEEQVPIIRLDLIQEEQKKSKASRWKPIR